ncbi:hypothetical protein [Actinopolymorpha alba]|uniref:hypothetical protein n=1 Tax=Actinopolymorpha alba TaxID=533267 RepID=UPI00038125A9|nr:hypothetical protein [Actinopolymorpha alba]
MRFLKGFGQFWYDFIIGDDWKIAVAVGLALAVVTLALVAGLTSPAVLTVVGGLLIVLFFTASILIDTRSHRS